MFQSRRTHHFIVDTTDVRGHMPIKSLWGAVRHVSSLPFSTILCVHRRESQLLQVVLDDVDPSFPLSIDICLQDSLGTVVFSPRCPIVHFELGKAADAVEVDEADWVVRLRFAQRSL